MLTQKLNILNYRRSLLVIVSLVLLIPVGISSGQEDVSGLDPSSVENVVNTSSMTPDGISLDWYQGAIDRSGAWEITQGSENVTVALIDTGIVWHSTVPDTGRWENTAELEGIEGVDDDDNGYVDDFYGWDFADNDNDPSSDSTGTTNDWYHGTITASHLIGLNGFGIAPNVKLINLRVTPIGDFSCEEIACRTNVRDAIQYATAMNASIINIPGGSKLESHALVYYDALKEAAAKNIPIITGTGNDGSDTLHYPANWPETIAVSGIEASGQLWSGSSYGENVDVSAPARQVPGIDHLGLTQAFSGLSWSVSITSAVVALMLSTRSDLNTSYVRDVLSVTARDAGPAGWDEQYGWGVINASAAVRGWLNFESMDFDGDGMNTSYEIEIGLSPFTTDTDGGGVDDLWELDNGWDPLDPTDDLGDLDNDGLTNGEEYQAGTDMNSADTDEDGLPDKYEIDNGTNPLVADADQDPDDDGLTNLREFQAGTKPLNADTDRDKMTDGYEVNNGLDPLTDDADEDLDDDGLINLIEFNEGTSANSTDTDSDGMDDKFEITEGLDPLDPSDADLDMDGDGATNLEEYLAGTDIDDASEFPEITSDSGDTAFVFLPVMLVLSLAPLIIHKRKR